MNPVPEDPALSSFKIVVLYLGTAIQLFVILMVSKTAYLATVKPLQLKKSLLTSFLSAFLSSQVIALGFHVVSVFGALVQACGNEVLTRSLIILLVLSALDFASLSLMKWRTLRTICGWLAIDLILVLCGLTEKSVYSPVAIGDLVRWLFLR